MSDAVSIEAAGARAATRPARRFAVLSALAFAAIVAVAIFSLFAIYRELTESALARRSALSEFAAATLAEKFDRVIDVSVSLATQVRFRNLVEAGQWPEAAGLLHDAPGNFPLIERIGLFDPQGTLLAEVPDVSASKRPVLASQEWFKTTLRDGKPVISAVFRRQGAPRRNVFVATAPIRSEAGAIVGVLAAQVPVEGFFGRLGGIDVGDSAIVYVVDRAGSLAYHPKLPLEEDPVDFSSVPSVRQALQGRRGVEIAVNPVEREERLSAFSPISRHGWAVVVAEPTGEVFETRNRLFGAALVAYLLIFAFFGAYLSGRVKRQRARVEEERRRVAERERLAEERRLVAQQALARQSERLRILGEIDRATVAQQSPHSIAEAAIRPLRDLLGVPRAIVNLFDLGSGEVEWLAAAGRRRLHAGEPVRYSIALMGDVAALRRGEPQIVDTHALPPGPEAEALLASGVHAYMVVPMIAGGELIGAISFGGERAEYSAEQLSIAQETATQLAIAITQTRLLERVRRHAGELEQRVAERTAALDAAKNELEDLYDNAPFGYHSVDADGRIVRMNRTWLSWLGYSRDEVVGKLRHPDLMTEESAARFWNEAFPLFRRQGWLQDTEFEYRRKDGSLLLASLSATSITDPQGRYLMSRSVVADISERKAAERRIRELNEELQARAVQLEQANKELESFSYSVSHDLRAPLRAVDGYALMLAEDYGERLDDEGRRLLKVVRASAEQMGRLIDDLLRFSQVGRRAIARSPIDMRALAAEVADELAARHPKTRIEIGALPAALGDRALLRHVWANLVGNALKYSANKESPRVEISGAAGAGESVYTVRDNGAGFDMRYYDKLFNVFQRLHREDEFEGTGVGLAIVQRVVVRHGGRVWGESVVGEGASFHFSLPAEV